ncbi:MAG: hypothetical protein IJJ20_07110 [Thermoguttaceae bacterium]|nr:hypothetical protein [Thermoguttaceae bacterium]
MLHRFSVSFARGCFPLLLFLAALCAASVSRALEETGKETGIQPPGIPVEAGTPVIVDTVPVVPGSPEIPYVMGMPVPASEVPEKTTKKVDTVPVVPGSPEIPYEMGVPVPASEVPEKTTKKVDTVPVMPDTPEIVDTVPAAVGTPVTDAIEKTTGVGKKLADISAAISKDSGAKRVIFVLDPDVEGTLLVLSYPAAESHSTPTVGLIKTDEHQTGKLTDASGNDFRVVKGSVLFEDADGNLSSVLFEDADGNRSATPPAADPSDSASDSAEGTAAPESSNPPVRHSMRFDVAPGGGIHSDSDEFNRVNDEIVGRESPLSYGEFLEMADSHDFDPSERVMLWKVMADRQNPPISKDALKELYETKRASIGDFKTTIYRSYIRSPFVYAFKGDDYRLWKTVSEGSSENSEKVIWARIDSIVKSERRLIDLYNHPDGKRSVSASMTPVDQVDPNAPSILMGHFPKTPLDHAWLSDPMNKTGGYKTQMGSLLGNSGIETVFEKPETLNGHSCLIVGSFEKKFYLDLEKDCSVYAVDFYEPAPPGGPLIGPGLYLARRTVLHGLKDYGGGVWLPGSVESITYNPDGSCKSENTEIYDKIEINSGIPDSFFTEIPEKEELPAEPQDSQFPEITGWCYPYRNPGFARVSSGFSYHYTNDLDRITHSGSEEFSRAKDEITGSGSPLAFGEFLELANRHNLDSQDRAALWAVMKSRQNPPVSIGKLREVYEKKRNFIGDFSSTYHVGLKKYTFAQKGESRLYIEGAFERSGGYCSNFYETASRSESAYRSVIRGPEVNGKSPHMALIMPLDILFTTSGLFPSEMPLSQAWLFRARCGRGVTGSDLANNILGRQHTEAVVFEKPEVIDGRSCLVVGTLFAKFYLDPEKDYAVYSVEHYIPVTEDGRTTVLISSKSVLHGLKDYGGGVWLPETAEILRYNPDGSPRPAEEYVYDEIKINSGIPDSFFDDIIPADAVVVDTRDK